MEITSIRFDKFKRKSLVLLSRFLYNNLLLTNSIKKKKLIKAKLKLLAHEGILEGHRFEIKSIIQLNERNIASTAGDKLIKIWD